MIIYRTAGPWGPGAGGNLSAAQVDGNFFDVASRVQFLELHGIQPVQITAFRAAGNQLYIDMSDGTTQGPLTLPVVRWFFRGNWTPLTVYNRDDVVTGPNGAIYLVIVCLIPQLIISGFQVQNLPLVGRWLDNLLQAASMGWVMTGLGYTFYFGGTSLLIVVGVAMDTISQVEAQLVMRHYGGFLVPRRGRWRGRRTA